MRIWQHDMIVNMSVVTTIPMAMPVIYIYISIYIVCTVYINVCDIGCMIYNV